MTFAASDIDVTEKLVADLRERIDRAMTDAQIPTNVYTVYDLDDLEAMSANNLGGCMAVGVGYNGTVPVVTTTGDQKQNVADTNAARIVDAQFLVILAVPVENTFACANATWATRILTAVRNAVIGRKPGMIGRPWRFMGEKPEPTASTRAVVYYSQAWHVALPVTGV